MTRTSLQTDVSPSRRYVRILIERENKAGRHLVYDVHTDKLKDLRTGQDVSEGSEDVLYAKMVRSIALYEDYIQESETPSPDKDWFSLIPGSENII